MNNFMVVLNYTFALYSMFFRWSQGGEMKNVPTENQTSIVSSQMIKIYISGSQSLAVGGPQKCAKNLDYNYQGKNHKSKK